MPGTLSKVVQRINIRLPKPMIETVDKLVKKNPLYKSRQEYVENAIRERLEQDRPKKGAS